MYPYLKQYFEEKGYTVYPEIDQPGTCKRADIVAIKDQKVVVVEMKVGFGLTVIQQACDWKGYAHQVYIAIPKPKKPSFIPPIGEKILAIEKIGLLEVDLKEYSLNLVDFDIDVHRIREVIQAPYRPESPSAISLINFITPYHLEGPSGGSQTGGHISGYQVTMRRVREYLTDRDWTTAKEIADNVETHYYAQDKSASLRQSLLKWESEWCEYQVIGGRGYFRIKSDQS